MPRFAGLNTQVLGISIDHVPCLKAWAESLGGITYPLLSDFWPHGAVSSRYGVLREADGYTERALALIDCSGILRQIEILDIDEQPDNEALRAAIRKMDPAAAAHEPTLPVPDLNSLPQGGIVMYCTRWCTDCKDARAWLQEHHLPYTEVDIYSALAAEVQVRRWTGGGLITPTFNIDGTIIPNFDRQRLCEVLGVKEE